MENAITCGFLLREINFIWERIAKKLLRETDLNWTQLGALGALAAAKEQELSLKELEKALGLTQSVVARMANQLTKYGYTEYALDPADRRVKRLRLLEKGNLYHKEIFIHMEVRGTPIFDGMSPKEQTMFRDLLERALKNSIKASEALFTRQDRGE